jgi:hypothetical protein
VLARLQSFGLRRILRHAGNSEFTRKPIWGVPMKRIFILLVSIVSIFGLLMITGAYFKAELFSLIKLNRTVNPSIIPGADIQILLYLSIAGLVGILRKRPNKK